MAVLDRDVVGHHPVVDGLGVSDVLRLGEQPQQLAVVGRVEVLTRVERRDREVQRGVRLVGVEQRVDDAQEVARGRRGARLEQFVDDLDGVGHAVGPEQRAQQRAPVLSVGERAVGEQLAEQRLGTVQVAAADRLLDDAAGGAAVPRGAVGSSLVEQPTGGLQVAVLEVRVHGRCDLRRRDRDAEQHRPVQGARGTPVVTGPERDVEQALDVVAAGDPAVFEQLVDHAPGPVDVLRGHARGQHLVAVERVRLDAGLGHARDGRRDRIGIAGTCVAIEDRGQHVLGLKDTGFKQQVQQLLGAVGVAGRRHHLDQPFALFDGRWGARLEHQLDLGEGVLDGATLVQIREHRLVVLWAGTLLVRREPAQQGAGGGEPLGAHVQRQEFLQLAVGRPQAFLVQCIEFGDRGGELAGACSRDGEVEPDLGLHLHLRVPHPLDHGPCPFGVAADEVGLEQEVEVFRPDLRVALLHRADHAAGHLDVPGAGEAAQCLEVLVGRGVHRVLPRPDPPRLAAEGTRPQLPPSPGG